MEKHLHKVLPFDPGGKGNTARVLETRAGKEPEEYYLQPYRSVIHNQSHYYKANNGLLYWVGAGSCVADAFTAILEKIEHYKGGEIYPSVSMLYGQTTASSGMYNNSASSYLINKGAMPFQYLGDVAPHMDVYTDALETTDTVIDGVTYKGAKKVFNELYPSKKNIMLKTRISSYSETPGIATSDGAIGTLQRAIKSPNQGVVFTIQVDGAFDGISDTGILKVEDYDYSTRGGHVINVVGWIHFGGVLHWIIQNSWAQNWGDRGYCYMPYNWRGITYYGVITGTNDPPAVFNDIPKKARYGTTSTGVVFEWDVIPNAVSYECKYKGVFTSNDYTVSINTVSFSTTDSMQFYYRAVYADGTKSLWSNVTRAVNNKIYKGIDSVFFQTTKYKVYMDSGIYCKHERYINVTDKNGNPVDYTGSSSLTVPIPPINNYYDIQVKLDYLLEAEPCSVSRAIRVFGDLEWQYMKDDTNKEVKLTAQEWNDACKRIETLSNQITGQTLNLQRAQSGQNISAEIYNNMLTALRIGFMKGSTPYITKTLIPNDVKQGEVITKNHFIQLKNAINSIKCSVY